MWGVTIPLFPIVRLRSMSELEGTLRVNADDSAADRKDWDDEDVRIDLTEPVPDVLDTTDEEEEVEDLIAVPRFKDCSLNVCVFVGRGETSGRGVGEGETMSFLNKFVFEGILGGVFFEGMEDPLVDLFDETLDPVSASSFVKVPCLTRPGSWCLPSFGDLEEAVCCVLGEVCPDTPRGEPVELRGDIVRGAGAFVTLLVSFLEFACRSCVALVPRTRRGDVCGDDAGLPRLDRFGLGATGGGTVARFIGGEYRARLLPRMPTGGATCTRGVSRVR